VVADVALILLTGGFAAALALQWLALGAAGRLQLYAHPNTRSFHVVPTPTGGGVAFVVPLTGYLLWLSLEGSAPALVLALGGGTIAAAGWWDDLREVSARLRLLTHAVAAAAFVWVLLPHGAWPLLVLLAFALVWYINLYNFMDGIDGLAGAQALVFALGVQVIASGVPGWPGDVLWLCAGTMLGFLVFNWPPARVFMGDVGSGFLGFVTGALALILWQQQIVPLIACLILLSGFWLDATYTLIVRVLTGQPFTQAHRSHLYQKVALRRGHLWTTVCYLLYAALWLLPLAWLSARYAPELSPAGALWLVPAAVPVLVAAWRLRAGLPERPGHE
jgi:Fuc2NAc and GlcNAc transferase